MQSPGEVITGILAPIISDDYRHWPFTKGKCITMNRNSAIVNSQNMLSWRLGCAYSYAMRDFMSGESWSLLCTLPSVKIRLWILWKAMFVSILRPETSDILSEEFWSDSTFCEESCLDLIRLLWPWASKVSGFGIYVNCNFRWTRVAKEPTSPDTCLVDRQFAMTIMGEQWTLLSETCCILDDQEIACSQGRRTGEEPCVIQLGVLLLLSRSYWFWGRQSLCLGPEPWHGLMSDNNRLDMQNWSIGNFIFSVILCFG